MSDCGQDLHPESLRPKIRRRTAPFSWTNCMSFIFSFWIRLGWLGRRRPETFLAQCWESVVDGDEWFILQPCSLFLKHHGILRNWCQTCQERSGVTKRPENQNTSHRQRADSCFFFEGGYIQVGMLHPGVIFRKCQAATICFLGPAEHYEDGMPVGWLCTCCLYIYIDIIKTITACFRYWSTSS